VLDQDRSAASHQLLAGLDGSGIFERMPICTVSVIWQLYRHDRRALRLCKSIRISSGHCFLDESDVQVIAGRTQLKHCWYSNGLCKQYVEQFNTDWRSTTDSRGATRYYKPSVGYNPNLETPLDMIPGLIGTLTLIQTMMLAAMSVARGA